MTLKNRLGKFIVISGPSGVGKGTICNILLSKKENNLSYSISMTTRKKRIYEKNGVDYYFTSRDNFKKRILNNEFLEYNLYNKEYYGTLKTEVLDKINKGINVISELDVNGAKKIKNNFKDCILIYITAPNIEELRRRLIKRGTENKEEIEQRLKIAIYEEKEKINYDYVIMNDNLEIAIEKIQIIIKNFLIDK